MIEINLETRINAPIDQVFDLVRNGDIHGQTAQWTGEQVVEASARMLELNDTVTFRAQHFGVWQSLSAKVIEFEPPIRLVDIQIKGTFRSLRHEHIFRADGEATIMTDRLQIAAPFGPLGWLAERLFLATYMKNFLIRKNHELKAIAEAPVTK